MCDGSCLVLTVVADTRTLKAMVTTSMVVVAMILAMVAATPALMAATPEVLMTVVSDLETFTVPRAEGFTVS